VLSYMGILSALFAGHIKYMNRLPAVYIHLVYPQKARHISCLISTSFIWGFRVKRTALDMIATLLLHIFNFPYETAAMFIKVL
jgi:hypothetical protein